MIKRNLIFWLIVISVFSCVEEETTEKQDCSDGEFAEMKSGHLERDLNSLSQRIPLEICNTRKLATVSSDTLYLHNGGTELELFLIPREISAKEFASLKQLQNLIGCYLVEKWRITTKATRRNIEIEKIILSSPELASQFLDGELLKQKGGIGEYECGNYYCRYYLFQHNNAVYKFNGAVFQQDKTDIYPDNCREIILEFKAIIGQEDESYYRFDYG